MSQHLVPALMQSKITGTLLHDAHKVVNIRIHHCLLQSVSTHAEIESRAQVTPSIITGLPAERSGVEAGTWPSLAPSHQLDLPTDRHQRSSLLC